MSSGHPPAGAGAPRSWLDRILAPIVPVQAGDGARTLATFTYFALVIMTYYVIKPATRSLMMSAVGGKNLTVGNFTTALIIGLTVMGFDFLAARYRRARLVGVVTALCGLALLLIWIGLRLGLEGWAGKALALSFFVFADIYSVLGVTLFWSFCHDIFTPAEGKRLYGVVGGGGALGGALGGMIAGRLAVHPAVGTVNLPLVALVPLGLTIVLAMVLERWFMADIPVEATKPLRGNGDSAAGGADRKAKSGTSGIEGLRLIATNRYLQAMIALLAAILLGSLIVETQFNMTVERAIQDTDARSSFMGYRDTQLTVIQFLSQVLLTGILIRHLGMLGVLLLFPLGNLLMGIWFFTSPTLGVANWAKIYDGAMKYGTNQVTKEMLYLPTSTTVKYQAKAFIDVFFHRVAKGLAAGLIWIMANQWGLSETGLFFPLAMTVLIWCGVVVLIDRLYRRTVQDRLFELFGGEGPTWVSAGPEEARRHLGAALTEENDDQDGIRAAAFQVLAGHPVVLPVAGPLHRAFASDVREGPPLAVEWLSLNLPPDLQPLLELLGPSLPAPARREALARGLSPG